MVTYWKCEKNGKGNPKLCFMQWFFYWKLLQYIADINMQLLSMQFFQLQSSLSEKKNHMGNSPRICTKWHSGNTIPMSSVHENEVKVDGKPFKIWAINFPNIISKINYSVQLPFASLVYVKHE